VAFVPDRGHLIWLTFDPQTGHEQAGRRPALVLSPAHYNQASGLALVCPVTSRIKGYPFEVKLPSSPAISGVVLVDQIKSLDWKKRRAALIAVAPAEVLVDVMNRLAPLLGF
jgi:mRNA interferase MazF